MATTSVVTDRLPDAPSQAPEDLLPPHVLTGHIRDQSHVMGVRESYDSAAEVYAQHLASELIQKPLDRHLLNRFAEETRGRGLVADLG